MTDKTPMEQCLARLNPIRKMDLDRVHAKFQSGEIDENELGAYLRFELNWDWGAVREYVNAACDASDYAPQAPASPNAQLAPTTPVERPVGTLKPKYGPR